MHIKTIATQLSAGLIVGFSVIIYGISLGALLFAGPLAGLVGYAVTASLITAAIGALIGVFSQEKAFISGPDANTISVLAGPLAVLGSLPLAQPATLNLVMCVIFVTSLVCAAGFYLVAHLNLANLMRFIPFSVMAGFLAASGWLMASGALNIIAATPLTAEGLIRFIDMPLRPELLCGIGVALALQLLSKRIDNTILIPGVLILTSLLINLYLNSPWCTPSFCERQRWLFDGLGSTQWLPPWALQWHWSDLKLLLTHLPMMLVFCFVGMLTMLLSVASLESDFATEFDLNRVIRAQSGTAALAAVLGGFPAIMSIGRTAINHKTGGGAVAGVLAALCCLAMVLGAGSVIGYIPKAALGGLILYLGISLLKQWFWNQRRRANQFEMVEITLIVVMVANYGYLVGFFTGLAIACLIFVVRYSRLPLVDSATNVALFSSLVIRPQDQVDILQQHGTRALLYRLKGYVFFGSTAKIDQMFEQIDIRQMEAVVIDFSRITGIDTSAIGVFQRILRRYHTLPLEFYFVFPTDNPGLRKLISGDWASNPQIHYFDSLDHALEQVEDGIIARHSQQVVEHGCFGFIHQPAELALFMSYLEPWQVLTGQAIRHQGEYSPEMFFVEQGSFEVVGKIGDNMTRRLAKLTKGAVTGEMAFYTGAAGVASIIALTDALVYVLHQQALERMRAEHPALATRLDHMVIKKLISSLCRTNKFLLEAK
jgi:sulfate permease, SulP family